MTTTSRPRKTRSDKGVKRTPKPTHNLPSLQITEDGTHTTYSLDYRDAITLVRPAVESNSYGHNVPHLPWTRIDFLFGGDTFEQVMGYLTDGWVTDRPPLDVVPMDDNGGTSQSLDVEGAYPDVAAYLSGDPECMMQYSPSPAPAKFIDLCVNLGVGHTISASDLYSRGKAVLSLVDALESQGARVKLSVEFTSIHAIRSGKKWRRGDYSTTTRISVKDYQDPIDEALVCFVLGHAAMPRGVYFAIADSLDQIKPGHCSSIRDSKARGIPESRDAVPGEIYIPEFTSLPRLEKQIQYSLNSHRQ